jgi:hypothetical protein
MFIQTETTPNPEVLKFLPGREVLGEGAREFRTAEEGDASPLAEALFRLGDVNRVFFGPDFLTVTKAEGATSCSASSSRPPAWSGCTCAAPARAARRRRPR